jgi:hypothetical protein
VARYGTHRTKRRICKFVGCDGYHCHIHFSHHAYSLGSFHWDSSLYGGYYNIPAARHYGLERDWLKELAGADSQGVPLLRNPLFRA